MNIERINELARKSRAEGLTPEEVEEQQKLRSEYIASFRRSLQATLDTVYVENENGELLEADCDFPACAFCKECTIGQAINDFISFNI